MATIRTGIELHDGFSSVLHNIIGAVNLAVSSMEEMRQSLNADVDTSALQGARAEIERATTSLIQLNEAARNRGAPAPPAPPAPPVPPPPPEWINKAMPIFTNSGADRFQLEVQSANRMLEQLRNTQGSIISQSSSAAIFPPNAIQDLNNMAGRIDQVRERIQGIENNPLNMGTDVANAGLEQLRSRLSQMVQEQEQLNSAVRNMDVRAANDAYMRLQQTVGGTERYIRDNADEQGRFNNQIRDGTAQANNLTQSLMRAAGAYISIQGGRKLLGASDQMTQTDARLGIIVDDGGSVEELRQEIFESAQRAKQNYYDVAGFISKVGIGAPDAFSSNDELVAFAETLNKSFKVAGTDATGVSSAMYNINQALAMGVVRGNDLTAILQNAPMVAQALAEQLGVGVGELRGLGADGKITGEALKMAVLNNAHEINEAFETIPLTFSDAMTTMKNRADVAFQPIYMRLSQMVNSDTFQQVINAVVNSVAIVAGLILNIFEMVGAVGGFISDNWSIIAPIIAGIAVALGLYTTALVANSIAQGLAALKANIHAAALALESGATFTATAAQYGLNAALLACPITWIILAIIALIAVLFAVASAIAKFTGIANTGFGVITGGVNVVIQFFKNLGLEVGNIALAIGASIGALGNNIQAAFHNAISSVQSWWYDLLSTALTVIEGICEALNKLPFVEFDYSGISSAAADYAAKSAAAAGNKMEYESISDAFNSKINTYDTFSEGWASDAFNEGRDWGDDKMKALDEFLDGFFETEEESPYNPEDYISQSGIPGNLDNIAGNTAAMADAMEIAEDDLKYMRDAAEQEIINRFTLAELKVDVNNNNTLTKKTDFDDMARFLAASTNEILAAAAEGGHI